MISAALGRLIWENIDTCPYCEGELELIKDTEQEAIKKCKDCGKRLILQRTD